jgi:hypothetical protein
MVATPEFADRVRIRATETEGAGVAGRVGQVYGETTPTVTGVTVVGGRGDAYALNVYFGELGTTLWFARDVVELVDHAPGTTIGTGPKAWVRRADGEWVRRSGGWTARLLRWVGVRRT